MLIRTNRHPNIYKQFGSFLREARKKAGFSQAEISRELSLSSSQFLSNIERGQCVVPLYIAKYLINKYKIEIEEMIEYLMELEKLNLKIYLGLVEIPQKIKTPQIINLKGHRP